MKNKRLTIAMLIMAAIVMACGNKEGTGKTAGTEAEPQTQTAVANEIDPEGLQEIKAMQSTWKTKKITVDSGDITPDISVFSLAFCDAYPKYKPNAALKEYLIQPKDYDEEKMGFEIDVEKNNGYISCENNAQYSWDTTCCYWKRKDGHNLVAFFLEREFENMENPADGKLLLFYDYDPATDVMTPEPELSEMVAEAVKSFPDYSVSLPDEGKNIEITTYTDNGEEDSYDSTSQMMVWDGQTFSIKK